MRLCGAPRVLLAEGSRVASGGLLPQSTPNLATRQALSAIDAFGSRARDAIVAAWRRSLCRVRRAVKGCVLMFGLPAIEHAFFFFFTPLRAP